MFGNFGAGEQQAFVLPAIGANVGMRFHFGVQDTDGVRVSAPSGATIRNATSLSTVGGYIESTALGAGMYVTAVTSNAYHCGGVTGVWSILE